MTDNLRPIQDDRQPLGHAENDGPDTPMPPLIDTVESLRHQRNLLAEALGKLLIAYGVIRADVALTGPELLLAADTATTATQGWR